MFDDNGLYYKKKNQLSNLATFREIMEQYSWAYWYQPNHEQAPWHWCVDVPGKGPYVVTLNIYPHIPKVYSPGYGTQVGWFEIKTALALASEVDGANNEIQRKELV